MKVIFKTRPEAMSIFGAGNGQRLSHFSTTPQSDLAKFSTTEIDNVDSLLVGTPHALGACMTNPMVREQSRPNCDTHQQPPLVLVVEDEPDTQKFMTGALVKEGIACITASSVEEAICLLRREPVRLTVLDWGLDRSGCEVLNAAKELHPAMPVIAISGMPFEVRTDAVVNNADAFLSKPFSATVLIGQVKQLLERTRHKPAIELPQRPEDILRLDQVQSIYVRHVVQLLEGNKSGAAEALGIHRHTVSAALKETPDDGGFQTQE